MGGTLKGQTALMFNLSMTFQGPLPDRICRWAMSPYASRSAINCEKCGIK